ncbi:MAG: O-methyltransferase [Christensenella sp.]|nr:O-methyltransferase [Christensenella sp.]
MKSQPFYHLRPNKSIDRTLFSQVLLGLSRILPISHYQYIGFGSFLFDDFKLLHDIVNISNMISLEIDPREYDRARFNIPYNCIDLRNMSSTEFISELITEEDSQSIVWLDFVEPKELSRQLADFAALLEKLNPNDVVRITLNANPAALGTEADDVEKLHEARVEKLKTRVQEAYLPQSLSSEDVMTNGYPNTLLRILQNVAMLSLTDDPPFSANFLFPLFSSVYADGQQMVTFTGIVLDNHEFELDIRRALQDHPYINFSFTEPNIIQIPALSTREVTELNKYIPSPEMREQLEQTFPFIFTPKDPRLLDSYILFYKYYPNYYKISL